MSKPRPVKEIYWGNDPTDTWAKFLKICKREGSSGSEKIRDLVRDYVKLHEPGNPQQLLTRFAEGGGAYRAPHTCCFCWRQGEYVGEYEYTKYRLCEIHAEWVSKQIKALEARGKESPWKIVSSPV